MTFSVNYGWKGKVGLIYMSSSEVMEPEFYAMSPEGVCTLTTRIDLPKMTPQGIKDMLSSKQLEECTQLLAHARCDVILFGGTSCSFLGGPEWEKTLLKRMKTMAGGITVINTSQSSVEALRAVNAKRIVIATPYIDEINEPAVDYFTKQGFDVLECKGLGYDDDHEIAALPLEVVYRLVRETDVSEANVVFISCTNLKTAPIIETLETDLKKPVISAIQASLWYALKVMGINDFVSGTGSLFER
jgi:maleate isomerase